MGGDKVDKHDMTYYGKCMVGGILSCGLTHTGVVPLDVAKCRMQTFPELKESGLAGTVKYLNKHHGTNWRTLAWAPTFVGYSMQGLGKFGFYEIFKDVYAWMMGNDPVKVQKYQVVGWLCASASAEFLADIMLCPMESVKVRMQTDQTGTVSRYMRVTAPEMMRKEGWFGFYKGLSPLWARQIPYTMMKFAMFERTVQFMYDNIFTQGKENYSRGTQLGISFASGYWAGIFCALVSHPADTMVSKLNQMETKTGAVNAMKTIYGEIGFKGLWKGLFARILMIGTLTGF